LGAVGRLTHQKGFEFLIKAIPLIKDSYPHIELWLIGDGELHNSLQKLAVELGVAEQVKFLGFRDDVPQLLKKFNLVVLPSLYEGLPFWLLEAMLAAKPIVATDALGINDVISSGHDGLLVAVSNPSALSEAICRLLSNKELAHTLGEQARQTVLTEYSLDRMINETTKVYLELVKQKENRLVSL
jgi:glycosyltransferase involved in cell wall biosynthesis